MQITSEIGIVSRGRDVQEEGWRMGSGGESATSTGVVEGDEEGRDETGEERRRRGEGGREENDRLHTYICDEGRRRACVCEYAQGETRPIVIAIPTGGMFLRCAVSCRPATKPVTDSSYCSLSSQQRSNRLHNLPPALLFAARRTHI